MSPRPGIAAKGFTLLEVLISLTIFMMVLMGVYEVFDTSHATYTSGQRKLDVQQNARVAMDEMVRRVRMAGYFPENFPAPPAAPPSPLLSNPVRVATDAALALYGDLDGSGASQVFLLCLSGTTLLQIRGATDAAASYTCSGGDILADNVTGLRFTYFDSTNAAIPNPLTSTYQLDGQALMAVPTFTTVTQRRAVQSILITLTARENVPGQQPQTFTLTSTIRLRNPNS